MSAGPKAIPLAVENSEWADEPEPVECYACKWKGMMHELLCEQDKDTLWCPHCRSCMWAFR